jgi:undecaprenyl-diphosphatase
MLFFAEALAFLIPVTLVYLWFESRESRRDSLFTFTATVLGISLTYLLGMVYFHNQPFATYDTIVSGGDLDNAFPSQHTASMFSVFWSFLYLKRRRMTVIFGVTGFLTGLGRVSVGHHYPFDILGGILSGILGLGVAVLLENSFSEKLDNLVARSYSLQRLILDKFDI